MNNIIVGPDYILMLVSHRSIVWVGKWARLPCPCSKIIGKYCGEPIHVDGMKEKWTRNLYRVHLYMNQEGSAGFVDSPHYWQVQW